MDSSAVRAKERHVILTRYFNIAPAFILPTFIIARHIYMSMNMEIYFRDLLIEEEILKVLHITRCRIYIYIDR